MSKESLNKSFEKEWRARFERFAQSYEADHLISGWSDRGLRHRLSLFQQLVEENNLATPSRILDLGCAAGTYVRFMADLGHRVIGMDYSIPSLQRAAAADPGQKGSYAGGDAYQLPFSDGVFDVVVSFGVLQSLENAPSALDEMKRVLRPGGLLFLEFLNGLEIIALIRSIPDRLRKRKSRVRTYSPSVARHWLNLRGFETLKRTSVFLPPRQLAWSGSLLESPKTTAFLEKVPGLSTAGAHAFIILARKKPS